MMHEQFYTSVLTKASENTYLQYSKKQLNENYLSGSVYEKIVELVKELMGMK